jgi:hypothetical protein
MSSRCRYVFVPNRSKKSTETRRTTSARRKVKNNRNHRRALIEETWRGTQHICTHMATNSHESRVESVIEEQISGLHIARKSTETTRTTSARRKVKNNRNQRRALTERRREVPAYLPYIHNGLQHESRAESIMCSRYRYVFVPNRSEIHRDDENNEHKEKGQEQQRPPASCDR